MASHDAAENFVI